MDGNNTASELPAEETFTPLLPAPSNLKANEYSARVDLEWDTHSGVTKYRVVAVVSDTDAVHEDSVIPAGWGPTTTRTYRPLTNGTVYTFRVVAVDDSDDSLETSMPSTVMATPAVRSDDHGVTFLPTNMNVLEGDSRSYTVTLKTEPTDEVTITVSPRDGGDADLTAITEDLTFPDQLTFTQDNWDEPQTVTVSAAEDDDGEAGITEFLHNVSSTEGSPYDGISTGGVTATENDDDPVGVTVWPLALRVPEGGSRQYTVRLDTEPTDRVEIAVTPPTGDEDLTTEPRNLYFYPSNLDMPQWDMPQTVTVSAAEDADRSDGTAIFEHSLSGEDETYYNANLDIDPVTATEADNDRPLPPRDRTRPRVTITSAAAAPVSGPFAVTIRFSENVYGFRLADIDVRNGTASHFKRRSSRTYTVMITPAASGEVRVGVGANGARDGAGNGNQPATPLVIATALQGRFESPAAGATVSGIDLIQGWTFAEAADVEIAEVVVYIDGQRETTIPCCSARPDVQAAYPALPAANTGASGWGLTYNWGNLAAGPHTLRVVADSPSFTLLSPERVTVIWSLAAIITTAELASASTDIRSEMSPVTVPSMTLNDSKTSDSKSSVAVRARGIVALAGEPASNVTLPEAVLKSPVSGVTDHPTVTSWSMAWDRLTVYEASLPSETAVPEPDIESSPLSSSLMVIQAGETVKPLTVPSTRMVSSPSTITSSSGVMVRVAVPVVSPARMVISEGRSPAV